MNTNKFKFWFHSCPFVSIRGRSFSSSSWRLGGSLLLLLLLLIGTASGCASAVSSGHNTALDGADLVAMTDDMAAKIAGDPEVQAAVARDGALRVVVQPVENQMRGEVLPRGPAEAFTARIRNLLSQRAPGQFTWIMNRDAYNRLRRQELGGIDLGPNPDAIQPEYALVARFTSLTDEDMKHRSSYYLCVFELSGLENRQILWSGSYEVKKVAVKGFLD
jgi:hypothetical protein